MPDVGAGRFGWWWGPSALRLSEHFRPALRAHFGRLSAADLYLRFGHSQAEILDAYVEGIDFQKSMVLGVFDDDLELIGAAHLSQDQAGFELGLSVLLHGRRKGVGAALLRRAMQQARLAKAGSIRVHCLSENHDLMRLVRRVGARVVAHGSESDGTIALPPSAPLGGWVEMVEEQMAVASFTAKAELLMARRMIQQLSGAVGGQ